MTRPIPIGIDDFRALREQGMEYVDKTLLVRDMLDKGAQVLLLPRPRRFGKTLNLSMLRCFFEKREEDLSPLFADLSIARAGEAYRAHFQRYPVISLTFKGIKAETWEQAWEAVRRRVDALFDEHRALLEEGHLSEREARDFRAVLEGTASRATYETALLDLSRALQKSRGEKVVILIDEYDAPIHAAWVSGYASEAIAFFRAFLTEGLKGNPHLFKAVLTGILRIAKESIFSGLNNLAVYTLLHPHFNTSFGEALEEELQAFTESVLSYHDTARRPEQVYHAFVIGLLATLEPAYEVRSNRESGRGRPDVTIRPRQAGKPGAVLELKVARPGRKTPEQALAEGLNQIRDRGYAAELVAAGASPVHAFAVAFDGKTVRVQGLS